MARSLLWNPLIVDPRIMEAVFFQSPRGIGTGGEDINDPSVELFDPPIGLDIRGISRVLTYLREAPMFVLVALMLSFLPN